MFRIPRLVYCWELAGGRSQDFRVANRLEWWREEERGDSWSPVLQAEKTWLLPTDLLHVRT